MLRLYISDGKRPARYSRLMCHECGNGTFAYQDADALSSEDVWNVSGHITCYRCTSCNHTFWIQDTLHAYSEDTDSAYLQYR